MTPGAVFFLDSCAGGYWVATTFMQELDQSLWKDIAGHDGYQVHPEGAVRSCWQQGGDVRKNGAVKRNEWRIRSVKPHKTLGYSIVMLGRGKSVYLHRLIAEAFIPNPNGLRTVNHKDGDRTNNRLENLEWMSYQDNLLHKHRVLKKQIGETTGMAILSNDDALDVFTLHKFGARSCDLADAFGVSRTAICHLVHGRTWNHLTHAV